MNSIHTRIDHLDLNLLRVFEAVFEAQHLTRAADMLALSPSAVSHALRRLRNHMADPLFARQGHAMVPTPACQRLAPVLFEHMARLRQLLQQWAQFDAGKTKQTFRIGMPESVELTLLPALQQEFFRQAPHASLVSTGFDRSSLSRLLSAGQLDAAIDVALPIGDPVCHQPLLRDSYCVVARRGHPLGRPPTLKQYLAARHVTVSGRAMGTVLEDASLLRRGVQRQVSLRCQNYNSALEIVANSDLLLTVPVHLSQHSAVQRRLQRWSPPFQLPGVPVSLYWHGSNAADEATQWLRSVVVSVVRAHWTDVAALNTWSKREYCR